MVTDDDRKVPRVACWWRLPLRANADGHVAVTQYHIPDDKIPWDGQWMPWSGHIDYFDGRNDWSWPFAVKTTNNFDEMDREYGDIYKIIYPTRHYLNVLDMVPPDAGLTSQWLQVTEPGNRVLPREGEFGYFRPRARSDWIVAAHV
jgi:hypothetical protein